MRIDRCKIVSFDMFDTLVSRCVKTPSDVFRLVELRAEAEGMHVPGFFEARVAAERSARMRHMREVTIEEIYEELASAGFEGIDCDALMRCELRVELDICIPRAEGRELYERALQSSRKVVIASDMYLPMEAIEAILSLCGYSGWERIFLSCECGTCKASGSMFARISKEMGVRPSDIIHIGDNFKSDILRARSRGLHTRYLPTKQGKPRGLAEGIVSSLCDTRRKTDDPLIEFGYRAFGPLLAGFSSWLAERCKTEKIEKVFFLARDGLVISRAVGLLEGEFPPSAYLYASRRALLVPSLAFKPSLAEAISLMFLGRTTTLRSLFNKMGLDDEIVERTLRNLGINPDVSCQSEGLENNPEAKTAYSELRKEINKSASMQLGLLFDYLRQESFEGRVAIVDIGWFGNMQVALEMVCEHLGIDVSVSGFYVGLCPDGKNQGSHQMEGYLFAAGTNEKIYAQERNFNSVFEIMFSANHGTTRGYERCEERVGPILAPYIGVEAKAGEAAERVREGALEFVADWARVCGNARVDIDSSIAFCELGRMGNHPTLEEAKIFGSWAIEDDGAERMVAQASSLAHYVTHPMDFVQDFDRARWKIGFLRRVFRLPGPYGKVWDAVHAVYNRWKS